MTVDEIVKQILTTEDVFDKVKLIWHLKKDKELRTHEIADKLNMRPSYLCHYMRLQRLPDIVIDGYYSKTISLSHLFIISRLKDPLQIIDVYEEILRKNFSVNQTEMAVRELLYGTKTKGQYLQKDEVESIEKDIQLQNEKIKINFIQSQVRSKLIIEMKGSLSETSPVMKSLLRKLQK